MKYFVVMPDGQKFGPADVDVLTQWAHEGRLTQQTILQDATSGTTVPAGNVPGIMFPLAQQQAPPSYAPPGQFSQPPGYSPYDRQYGSGTGVGKNEVLWGWVMFALSLTCLGCIGSLIGSYFSKKAMQMGNPDGRAPYIANNIVTGLSLVVAVLWCLLFFIGFSTGPR